jgi:hypothetical protein
MSKKARLFLILACISLVVTMLRFVHSSAVPAKRLRLCRRLRRSDALRHDGDVVGQARLRGFRRPLCASVTGSRLPITHLKGDQS